MAMIDTWVCVDDEHIYPARLDRSNRWNGWVSPGFTLDAVRQLAAHTEEAAATYGHDCVDQIKVIDGAPEPVVLHVRWQYLSDEPTTAANVVKPDADGRYWIGGWEWTWYEVEDGPLFYTQRAAYEAWKDVLTQSARRVGEIVRTQMPDATSCLIDPASLGHIVRVERQGGGWPTGTDTDGEDGYGPFDTETLGEADEVLRKALDHGRDPSSLEVNEWRPARDIGEPELLRVTFAPLGQEAAGDGPLDEARTKATEARRKLLTETAPYLAEDCRSACPEAAGVLVDPTADQPFVMFLVDDTKGAPSIPVPSALAEKPRPAHPDVRLQADRRRLDRLWLDRGRPAPRGRRVRHHLPDQVATGPRPGAGHAPAQLRSLHPTRANRGRHMTNHSPQHPTYRLPDSSALSAAAHTAVSELSATSERIGRVMAVVTAAAVRDAFTRHDPAGPFDARYLELVEGADRSLFATGAYWTAAGERRTFVGDLGEVEGEGCTFDINEWVVYLNHTNELVWRGVSEKLPAREGRRMFRMDLQRAADLPLS